MIEIIFKILVISIFKYPGALIRWLFLRKRRTFKSILDDNRYGNAMLALFVLALIVLLIKYLLYGTIIAGDG